MSDPAHSASPERDTAHVGADVVKGLYASTKLGHLYGFDGRVAREAREKLMSVLHEAFTRYGGAMLRLANETLYLNEARLRMDFDGFVAFRYVVNLFDERGIGEIAIPAGVQEPEVVQFLEAVLSVDLQADEPPLAQLERAIIDKRVTNITVGEPREIEEEADDEDPLGDLRQASIQAYFRSIFVVKSLAAQSRRPDEPIEMRKAKRVVHEMVDLLERDETTLLSLIALKNFGDYAANHAANVAALSIVIGKRVGLPRPLLADLGLCALLHDIGRNAVEDDGTDDEERHAVAGARTLLRDGGYADGAVRAVLTARWHHEGPTRASGGPSPLMHRIVRVADVYDTLTTPAGPRHPALAPATVINLLSRDDGTHFDPLVVKTLASVCGPHPLGTVIDLDTGERTLVCGRNPHFDDPRRPVVRVLQDEYGDDVTERTEIDLSRVDREKGRFAHEIVQSYSAGRIFKKPADFVDAL